MNLQKVITSLVRTVLVAHIVVTAIDNLPDDKISIRMRFPSIFAVPQWRFFAPNPGIEDLYIMYRSRQGGMNWSPWRDLSFRNTRKSLTALWNPGSRNPKALFDTASQVRLLASSGATFEWILDSEGYRLLRDTVRDACTAEGVDDRFQFMILASLPAEGVEGINPIIVSPELTITGAE